MANPRYIKRLHLSTDVISGTATAKGITNTISAVPTDTTDLGAIDTELTLVAAADANLAPAYPGSTSSPTSIGEIRRIDGDDSESHLHVGWYKIVMAADTTIGPRTFLVNPQYVTGVEYL